MIITDESDGFRPDRLVEEIVARSVATACLGSTRRKRHLSARQLAKRVEINERILAAVSEGVVRA